MSFQVVSLFGRRRVRCDCGVLCAQASSHSSGSPESDKGREMEMRWLVVAVSRRGRSKAIKVHSITGMEWESLSVPLPIRNSNLPLSSAAVHADQKGRAGSWLGDNPQALVFMVMIRVTDCLYSGSEPPSSRPRGIIRLICECFPGTS